MATKQFGLSAPDQRWWYQHQQQNALLFGWAGTFSREGVMEEVQTLLQACYNFGVNPLPALRKSFSALKWEYWRQEGMAYIGGGIEVQVAAVADFVWPVSNTELVSASRKDRSVDSQCMFFFNRTSGMLSSMSRRGFNVGRIVGSR